MQTIFPFVVFGAVALSVVASVGFLISKGSLYDQIGQGGMLRDSDYASVLAPAPDSPAGRAEREVEIRQLIAARSDRLVARGEPALDVDAEVARLMEPALQPEGDRAALTEEVRQLVIARNERRERQGLEPLEVEAEVTRTLQEFDP